MSYDSGNFSVFNQSSNILTLFADLKRPAFNPPNAVTIGNLWGSLIAPAASTSGSGLIANYYGELVSLTLSPTGGTISAAYGVNVAGPSISAGQLSKAYSLFITPSSGSGAISGNYTAYFEGLTGFATTTPMNRLDVLGSVAIGTYAGVFTAPSNSLLVTASLGIGTPTPANTVDVIGIASANIVYAPGTTQINQAMSIAQGIDQGGFGGGSVGTVKVMSANTMASFNLKSNVNSVAVGFTAAVFDGRYLYFIPASQFSGFGGTVVRYDTFGGFTVSSSYTTFNLRSNFSAFNLGGGVFDGKYVYFVPDNNGVFTRYDTTLPFSARSSYGAFTLTAINTQGLGFLGGVFDGRYIYLVPNSTNTFSGWFMQYDTLGSFTASSSYLFFDTSTVQSLSRGFEGGAFDGRYVYLCPSQNSLTRSGQITRYDTTLSFSTSTSYAVFDTSSLNSASCGFSGAIFDGRFLYFVPNINRSGNSGQITRYDTTASFSTSTSYSFFDTAANLNSISVTFFGGTFDGRYVYFVPNATTLGQVTRYDTTLPFSLSTSYALFDTAGSNTLSSGFSGAGFDGKYIYLVPLQNNITLSGLVVRLDAYPGPLASAATAIQAAAGFTIGAYAGLAPPASGGLIAPGRLGIGVSSPSVSVDATGGVASATRVYSNSTTFNNQLIGLFEGENQGGYASGSVGVQKTMNANQAAAFDLTSIMSSSIGFRGTIADGRYIYFVPTAAFLGSDAEFIRYDSVFSFQSPSSYSLFNLTTLNSTMVAFYAAGFDGRYVYLAPFLTGSIFVRYDTTLSFTSASSYQLFDLNSINTFTAFFWCAAFDGRYLYLGSQAVPVIWLRYDTTSAFNATSSYNSLVISTVVSFTVGFAGATFDGRYVYLSPAASGSNAVRYDITLPFEGSSSYEEFNFTFSLNSTVGEFTGAVFDGRYVYYMPYSYAFGLLTFTYSGRVVRYDSTSSYSSIASYTIFDLAAVNSLSGGFLGGVFDGRYLYFIPYLNLLGSYSGNLIRYDITLPFSSTASYTMLDLVASVNSNSRGFTGGVFDGRYLYFGPVNTTDARRATRIEAYPGPQASAITALQAAGGFSVGLYAGMAPPVNGLLVSGNVGIGVSSPSVSLDATGGIVSATSVYTNDTTFNNQVAGLFEGNNQGGFGSGFVGTQKTMSANGSVLYDLAANVNSLSYGFNGGVFDGRYIYLTTGSTQILTRYDSFQPLQSPSSYSLFDVTAINTTFSTGGGAFDGRYVYFAPFVGSPIFIRYDTSLPFGSLSSYSLFNLLSLNTVSNAFSGAVFDGRYVYLVPYALGLPFGVLVQYDTFNSFSSTSSYSTFDLGGNLNSLCGGFQGAAFDGRYIYFVPGSIQAAGLVAFYDTSLPFGASSSYAFFNPTVFINSSNTKFQGAVFDGRYVYYIPNATTSNSPMGQILRYDTTLPFAVSASYASFDTAANVSSLSVSFFGGSFDGRYLYLVPSGSQVTRYDTILPFSSSASYSIFTIPSTSGPFQGAVFDGKYIYFVPTTLNGALARLDAYLGPQATAVAAAQAAGGFSIGTGAGSPANGLLVAGFVGIGVSSPTVSLDVGSGIINASAVYAPGSTFNHQIVNVFEGYNQGGFASGSVGTQKTMSSATSLIFDLNANINTSCNSFLGSAFDGRYLYLASSSSGQVARFDTTLPFQNAASYAVFNTSGVNTNISGFADAAFDGKYIYFTPTSASNILTQYDTTQVFSSGASYSTFNTASGLNSNCIQFRSGVFDGRYLYFIPGLTTQALLLRYDTTLPFSISTSYSFFNLTSAFNSNANSFVGGLYDGQYLYLIPGRTSAPNLFIRYDTTLGFSASSSYASFNTGTISSLAVSYFGGTFDGRFVYLSPNLSAGIVLRYDTAASFTGSSSYLSLNLSANLNPSFGGFVGAVFDGRYVYYAPNSNGQIVRFDTTSGFSLGFSYSAFDSAASFNSNSTSYWGGIFDGRYVYFIQNAAGTGYLLRLDAYPGPQATVSLAAQASNGLSVATNAIAPPYGLLVGSSLAIGTTTPAFSLDVQGAVNATRIYASGTTYDSQLVSVGEGNSQGGFGGGSPGTIKTMSANQTAVFTPVGFINTASTGFNGIVFDGRYIYFVPAGTLGLIARYDTTLPFGASSSYQSFSLTASIASQSFGFSGGSFDGRYIYFIPSSSPNAQITRYDTASSFSMSSSYSIFPLTTALNSNASNFQGAIFDGRYLYLVPMSNPSSHSGQIVQYDTTLSFSTSTSYALFDVGVRINSNSKAFQGGAFDGRYVYFAPAARGNATLYDTAGRFGTTTTYAVFNFSSNLNSNCLGYGGAVFDGRYVYYVPTMGASTYSGLLIRYDTAGSFTVSASYALFDTVSLNSNARGFSGGVFDGRYLYLAPKTNGRAARYDTTLPFTLASSYAAFDFSQSVNSLSFGFSGAISDGKYVYFSPYLFGQITRIDAYPGSNVSAIAASNAPNGFAVGTLAGAALSAGNVIVGGAVGIGTVSPNWPFSADSYVMNAQQQVLTGGSTETNQCLTLAEGNNQGGFGSGSVGTQKTMSDNTIALFDTTAVNSKSTSYAGAVFDGRFLYLIPSVPSSGSLTRYDTVLPFSSSLSYALYDLAANVNTACVGFNGGLYDGRYVYFVPFSQSLLTQYDTTLPFALASSYATFSLASGLYGGIFDGIYLYFPNAANATIQRYNTTLPLTSSNSYASFDSSAVVSGNYIGGSFDGRYVYFAPFGSGTGGVLLQYDTTLSFTSAASYASFNTAANLNSGSFGFWSAVFDGRYLYLSPYLGLTVTRYDTSLPFSTSSSYAVFNATASFGFSSFKGALYDGRYLYFMPASGTTTLLYDTTLSFSLSASYATKGISGTTSGAIFDGKYVYSIPGSNGLLNRLDAYPGVPLTALNAYAAPQGLTLASGSGITLVSATTAITATSGAASLPTLSAGFLSITINGTIQKIPYF